MLEYKKEILERKDGILKELKRIEEGKEELDEGVFYGNYGVYDYREELEITIIFQTKTIEHVSLTFTLKEFIDMILGEK